MREKITELSTDVFAEYGNRQNKNEFENRETICLLRKEKFLFIYFAGYSTKCTIKVAYIFPRVCKTTRLELKISKNTNNNKKFCRSLAVVVFLNEFCCQCSFDFR